MGTRRSVRISQTNSNGDQAVLHNPWLTIGRIVWLLVVTAVVISMAAFAFRGARIFLSEPAVEDSFAALSPLITYQTYTRLILVARYSVLIVYLMIGVFIFWRASTTVIGLVTSLTVILLPQITQLLGNEAYFPEWLGTPFGTQLLSVNSFLTALGFTVLLLFIHLFPTGRFPTAGLKRIGLASFALLAVLSVVSLGVDLDTGLGWILFLVGPLIALVVGIAGAVFRYMRVSGPTERLQTRWVLASLALLIAWQIFIAGSSPFRSWNPWAAPFALFQLVGGVIVAVLVPLSITRAILRFHLWDIDVIVRKTVVYTLLSGVLLGVYLLAIILLQWLFSRVAGELSPVITVLSTLLIAALFLPLRRRIQDGIDRRFFRRKYDAEKTLEQFAATARDETDLDKLTAELLRVIQETMQPEHLSLWLLDETRPSATGDAPSIVTFNRHGVTSTAEFDQALGD